MVAVKRKYRWQHDGIVRNVLIVLILLVVAISNVYMTETPLEFDDDFGGVSITVPEKFNFDGASGKKLVQIAKEKLEWYCQNGASAPIKGAEKVHIRPLIPGKSQAFDMMVYSGLGSDIVSNFIKVHGWEMDTLRDMASMLQGYAEKHSLKLSDLTFVDIGANIGWFTLNMAAVGVNVIAFEPMDQNLRLLRSSLCLNKDLAKRVAIVERGLSTEKTTCTIYSAENNRGDGHLECHKDGSEAKTPPNGDVPRGYIKTVRLDDLALDAPHTVLVKMDVEGFEAHVVDGGPNFFFSSRKIPYIFAEVSPVMISGKGSDPREFMRNFLDKGYTASEGKKKYDRESALDMRNFRGSLLGFPNVVLFQPSDSS